MKITRGDTKNYKFKRINKVDGSTITEKPEKMFFTIKYDYNVDNYLIQKKLDSEIIFNVEDNYYYFTIKSQDTDNLAYGKYVYDIQVTENGEIRTIALGEIQLTEEVTFADNIGNNGVNGEDIVLENDNVEEIVTVEEYAPIVKAVSLNYEELENKPSINNIELTGKKSLEELGIQPAGDYATAEYVDTSIQNLSKNVTNNTNNINELKSTIGEINTTLDTLVTVTEV